MKALLASAAALALVVGLSGAALAGGNNGNGNGAPGNGCYNPFGAPFSNPSGAWAFFRADGLNPAQAAALFDETPGQAIGEFCENGAPPPP